MLGKHPIWRLIGVALILVLGSAGCGSSLSSPQALTSPIDQTVARSVVPSPTSMPTTRPTATAPAVVPTATTAAHILLGVPTVLPAAPATTRPAARPVPVAGSPRVLILHTNDNWGETEPCG